MFCKFVRFPRHIPDSLPGAPITVSTLLEYIQLTILNINRICIEIRLPAGESSKGKFIILFENIQAILAVTRDAV